MLITTALLALSMLAPQDAKARGGPAVDQARIDEAIRRGVAYLKGAESPGSHHEIRNSDELILLTLLHAGLPDNDPKIQELVKRMLEKPLEATYSVALQAMCLEEFERVKYQGRIVACAQFLVDNQCRNGQWGYGDPSTYAKDVASEAPRSNVASAGGRNVVDFGSSSVPGSRVKPKVVRRLSVKKMKDGPADGDNSNSQYAALGLRACHDAGIVIPKDVVMMAKKWWLETAIGDKEEKPAKVAVATGPGPVVSDAPPRGWCYHGYNNCKSPDVPYAAMTAGATGALVIYDFMLGNDWKKSVIAKSGISWLAKNWSVEKNTGPSEVEGGADNAYYYYYLYALERLGVLFDTDMVGTHYWYAEGANVILSHQDGDGSWNKSKPEKRVWDTCFAILFLKRATRPLVASQDIRK